MLPDPWKIHRCSVIDPETKQLLDEGLAVYFTAPKSFTREGVLELHIHSGRAITIAVLSALSKLPACRMAEPGEFTRRAVEKGRLDLIQVKRLKDLIDAETKEQRRWALSAAHVTVRDEVELLRKEIIACLVLSKERALALIQKLQMHLQDSRRREIMQTEIRIVTFGEPNAGKSSLLNWLGGRLIILLFSSRLAEVDAPFIQLNAKQTSSLLKRPFTKSDNRFIGYEWVSPSNEVDHEGKDIRDSLASACALATEGLVRPRIAEDLIAPFERAPDILNNSRPDGAASSLLQGAVAVIRLQ